ncbi:MAG: PilZ domain-containing protein [Deltaproteobacteria bacterium]|nr:PilZ domain-containing protein [Deltaproteobacteria bacterium]
MERKIMEEQRKFDRFETELDAVIVAADDTRYECRVVEVSRDGLRLHLPDKLRFGQKLHIDIALPAPVQAELLLRWTKQVYDDREYYAAGAEIIMISDADRELLLGCVDT